VEGPRGRGERGGGGGRMKGRERSKRPYGRGSVPLSRTGNLHRYSSFCPGFRSFHFLGRASDPFLCIYSV
jgi:hypothetical protein